MSAQIRMYRPEDREQIVAIHKRRCEADEEPYLFADPDDPIHFQTVVAEDEGRVVMSVAGRKTIEGFVALDPAYGVGREGPRKRWDGLREMLAEAAVVCYRAGYHEIHAKLMPWHERGYGRRLVTELGFTRDLRSCFFLDLNAVLGKGET